MFGPIPIPRFIFKYFTQSSSWLVGSMSRDVCGSVSLSFARFPHSMYFLTFLLFPFTKIHGQENQSKKIAT